MKSILTAIAAAAALAAAMSVANAQPIRTRVFSAPVGLTADEVRDYQIEQMERRHEMEREALRFDQRAERRQIDPDD